MKERVLEKPFAFRRRTYSREGDGSLVEHDVIFHNSGHFVLEAGAVLPKYHAWIDEEIIGPMIRLREVRVYHGKPGREKDSVDILYEDGRRKMHVLARPLAG